MRSRKMRYNVGMKGGVETRAQRSRRLNYSKEVNRAEGEKLKREGTRNFDRETSFLYERYLQPFKIDDEGIDMGALGAENIQTRYHSSAMDKDEWIRATGRDVLLQRQLDAIDAETEELIATIDKTYYDR